MQFVTRKRRPAPGVMIVSLIDIMMVLLIFLMITSTFKKQPYARLQVRDLREQYGDRDTETLPGFRGNEHLLE